MEDLNSSQNFKQHFTPAFDVQRALFIFMLVTMVVWYVKYLWKRRKIYWHLMNVPGPWGLPIIGTGYMFLGSGMDILNSLLRVLEKWPGLCKMWMGQDLILMVSEPEHIETILNSPFAIEKLDVYSLVSEVLGDGILTAQGKKWKHHRKTIAPSFNQKVLDSFVDIFAEKSKIFAEKLKTLVGQKNIDLYILASRCTLDTVCQTVMGVNMDIQSQNKEDLGECLESLMETINYKIYRIWLQFSIFWNFSKTKQEFDKSLNQFQKVTSMIITKKMQDYAIEKKLSQDSIYEATEKLEKKRAFLDLIVESSNFSEDELRAEMETFIGAGTETSAATICALFTVLGIFPDIQDKVYEEVIEIMGPDRDVEATDLPKMKYTERVIKETLRLFPIAAVFGRKVTGDINLGDLTLPSGCSAAFCVVYIHRNPKYWKDPLKFDPDRFLPEEVAKRHPCTYIPFSYGPRNCIGGRYAILNIKAVVATIIRQFRILSEYKSIEEIELKMQLLLRLAGGFKVSFELR